MLPTDHLMAFVLVAVVLILVPGPSVLFVVARSLTLGPKAGIATVVGNAAGVYLQVVAVAFGLGTLVQESITVYTIIKFVGAAYLVYLGVQTFRRRRSLAAALSAPVEPKVLRRILGDAFLVGVFNPKVIVFFMAVLPQFVDRSAGAVPVQLLLLGADLLRHRAAVRQHVGSAGRRRALVARLLAAPAVGDRRRGGPRDRRAGRRRSRSAGGRRAEQAALVSRRLDRVEPGAVVRVASLSPGPRSRLAIAPTRCSRNSGQPRRCAPAPPRRRPARGPATAPRRRARRWRAAAARRPASAASTASRLAAHSAVVVGICGTAVPIMQSRRDQAAQLVLAPALGAAGRIGSTR